MTFDPAALWPFTSVSTLLAVWVLVACGLLSALAAWRLAGGPRSGSPSAVITRGVLAFVSVISWFFVLAWLVNHHI
jgi:hypothetical protein